MFDTFVVRIALIIYVLIAGFAVLILGRNSAAPDSMKNCGILLASILPVLIAVLPYLNSEKIEKHFTFALFYDATNKNIISGDILNAYSSSYIHMFTNTSEVVGALKAETLLDMMESKGLDLIEKGIVEALFMKFSIHWDIESRKFEGPVSSSESWDSSSKLKSNSLELAKIHEIFKHNPLIATAGVIVHPQICLPPGSKVRVEAMGKSRIIIISNPYVTIRINFYASSGTVAQQGVWGVFTPDPKNMNRYYAIEYKIDSTLFINRMKTYSPEMKHYQRWFENICDTLSRYDWSVIDKKIERNLNREAISKTLGK